MVFYLMTLLAYFLDDAIWLMGLNLQMGMAGIINLGYVVFLGIGAYFAAVVTMGPSQVAMAETYIFGAKLPFPIPWIVSIVAVAVLAYMIGFIVLRRMRGDYLAVVTLSVAQIVWTVVDNDKYLFNGVNGLALIPQPWQSAFHGSNAYDWFFLALMAAFFLLSYWFSQSYYHSPIGRASRAVRENEAAAAALGKDPFALRMTAFIAGACLSAVAGALLVEYITDWSPSAWAYVETFTAISALIVGGRGNNKGAILGALLVPVLFNEVARLLPPIGGNATLNASLQWVAIGILIIAFLWYRPAGVVPERKARWKWDPPKSAGHIRTLSHLTEGVSHGE